MEPRTGKMQVSLTPDDCERLDWAALGAGVTASTLGARIIADNVRDADEIRQAQEPRDQAERGDRPCVKNLTPKNRPTTNVELSASRARGGELSIASTGALFNAAVNTADGRVGAGTQAMANAVEGDNPMGKKVTIREWVEGRDKAMTAEFKTHKAETKLDVAKLAKEFSKELREELQEARRERQADRATALHRQLWTWGMIIFTLVSLAGLITA